MRRTGGIGADKVALFDAVVAGLGEAAGGMEWQPRSLAAEDGIMPEHCNVVDQAIEVQVVAGPDGSNAHGALMVTSGADYASKLRGRH